MTACGTSHTSRGRTDWIDAGTIGLGIGIIEGKRGLDRGESERIWLANELAADLFITDEFNTTNYRFVNLALDDRDVLFTTPHILCTLAIYEILPREYVASALTYYVETENWNAQYVAQLRQDQLQE